MQNKHDREVDMLLAQAAKAVGADKADEQSAQVRALIEKLSPDDIQKLRAVLSDKSQVRAILSSPQGQQLMAQLSKQIRKEQS